MRRVRERTAGNRVYLTLTFDRRVVEHLDQAARLLCLSREQVLERGFDLLSLAAGVVLGHGEHCAEISPGA